MGEEPHDQAERDQADQAIGAEFLDEADHVADDAAEEGQGAADQECRHDGEG